MYVSRTTGAGAAVAGRMSSPTGPRARSHRARPSRGRTRAPRRGPPDRHHRTTVASGVATPALGSGTPNTPHRGAVRAQGPRASRRSRRRTRPTQPPWRPGARTGAARPRQREGPCTTAAWGWRRSVGTGGDEAFRRVEGERRPSPSAGQSPVSVREAGPGAPPQKRPSEQGVSGDPGDLSAHRVEPPPAGPDGDDVHAQQGNEVPKTGEEGGATPPSARAGGERGGRYRGGRHVERQGPDDGRISHRGWLRPGSGSPPPAGPRTVRAARSRRPAPAPGRIPALSGPAWPPAPARTM